MYGVWELKTNYGFLAVFLLNLFLSLLKRSYLYDCRRAALPLGAPTLSLVKYMPP